MRAKISSGRVLKQLLTSPMTRAEWRELAEDAWLVVLFFAVMLAAMDIASNFIPGWVCRR